MPDERPGTWNGIQRASGGPQHRPLLLRRKIISSPAIERVGDRLPHHCLMYAF
jgi:hypothetical protein